ncbi:MAG: hypothetical protein ACYSU0_16040 [Planctomycetota bacterium]|jgi:hydroxymethylbilane synthase
MELKVGCDAGPLGETQGAALVAQLSKLVQGAEVKLVPVPPGEEPPAYERVFASALELALLNGEVDIAVRNLHHIGIFPPDGTGLVEGVKLAAVTQRIDEREAVVTGSQLPLMAMPEGTQVIVDCPRRACQVRGLRGDLEPVIVSVAPEALIESIAAGDAQAVLVALADLRWMNCEANAAEILPVETVMPAPGQGALGMLVREADAFEKAALAVHHKSTWPCVRAERAVFAALGWTAFSPAAAVAEIKDEVLALRAAAFGPEGDEVVRAEGSGDPHGFKEIAQGVVEKLKAGGAEAIVDDARLNPQA